MHALNTHAALLAALEQITLCPLQHGDEAIDHILRIASSAIAAAKGGAA